MSQCCILISIHMLYELLLHYLGEYEYLISKMLFYNFRLFIYDKVWIILIALGFLGHIVTITLSKEA